MLTTESFEFKIKDKIRYGSDHTQESDTLYLFEPMGVHQRYYEVLDGLLCKALVDFGIALNKGEKESARSRAKEEQPTHQEMVAQIKAAIANLGENTGAFYDEFRKLLVSGVCFFDGDKKHSMKSGWLEKLRPGEWKELVCQYAARFISPKLD